MPNQSDRPRKPVAPKDGDPFQLHTEGPGYKLAAHLISELGRVLRWLFWAAAIVATGVASGVPAPLIERLLP